MNTTRTDVHTPSRIIPSDYEYIAIWTMNIPVANSAQVVRFGNDGEWTHQKGFVTRRIA